MKHLNTKSPRTRLAVLWPWTTGCGVQGGQLVVSEALFQSKNKSTDTQNPRSHQAEDLVIFDLELIRETDLLSSLTIKQLCKACVFGCWCDVCGRAYCF